MYSNVLWLTGFISFLAVMILGMMFGFSFKTVILRGGMFFFLVMLWGIFVTVSLAGIKSGMDDKKEKMTNFDDIDENNNKEAA
jgi:hypothetical protein